MNITVVVGARPNFVKIAPILRAFRSNNIDFRLVHTGQHYNQNLSGSFFENLGIPNPDVNFNIGTGTQAEQTGNIMICFERELRNNATDYVLVVGDVNSSLACGIVAKKEHVPLIHVEAGLRSGDQRMPEEINRIIIDRISDLCFTTTREASKTLISEGQNPERIHFVGNVMIDSLQYSLPNLKKPAEIDLPERYFVLTLHRPSNVDEKQKLRFLLDRISDQIRGEALGFFPVHPRTRKALGNYQIPCNIKMTNPLNYLEFVYLMKNALGVITDSGGIQEETTFLGIPCLTVRDNSERPETITLGTNELIGENNLEKLKSSLQAILDGKWKIG